MKIEIMTHHALPCSTKIFKINGINADQYDFGDMEDGGVENYACQNMHFVPNYSKEYRQAAMLKYGITNEEYLGVCERLRDELYVGECGWCV